MCVRASHCFSFLLSTDTFHMQFYTTFLLLLNIMNHCTFCFHSCSRKAIYVHGKRYSERVNLNNDVQCTIILVSSGSLRVMYRYLSKVQEIYSQDYHVSDGKEYEDIVCLTVTPTSCFYSLNFIVILSITTDEVLSTAAKFSPKTIKMHFQNDFEIVYVS